MGKLFDVKKALSSIEFAGQRSDDGNGRDHGRVGRSPANPMLPVAVLTTEVCPNIQNPDFKVDIAKPKTQRILRPCHPTIQISELWAPFI